MRQILKFYLIAFLSFNLYSFPAIDTNDRFLINCFNILSDSNLLGFQAHSYPLNIAKVDKALKEIELSKLNDYQLAAYNCLNKFVKDSLKKTRTEVEINTGSPDFSLNTLFNDNRFSDYFYIKQQFNGKNFSINIENYSVDENGTKNFLDNSYISYVNGNTIYSIGNKTLWWSPSNDNSLVISNNTRTPFGLYIQNKNSIKFNRKIINKLGSLDYAFFIRKLESSRHIPNAKLFGLRLSFYPADNFNFSVFRTAQWGGENRPQDANSFFNMLIGRENRGDSGIDFNNDPGNQLAGIDFTYNHINSRRNIKIYSQIAGEDEAGFLPSKNFYTIGFSSSSFENNIRNILEYTNTYSGKDNYTYAHGVYKDGYRFYGKSLGASIDADSQKLSYYFVKKLNNETIIEFNTYEAKINENNSLNNFLSPINENISGQSFKIIKLFKHDIKLEINIFKNSFMSEEGLAFKIRKKY